MNVIVSNRYQALLSELQIDVIKSVQGEFAVEELINMFSNFFFNKMIIDITAIKDYQNLATMQHLSVGMDMSKVILLLDESPIVNSPAYLSELVSMGIYNFSRNIDTIRFLIDNPNSYKDVAGYHKIRNVTEEAAASSGNAFGSDKIDYTNYSRKVIGFKNVTDHAGATTLVYMLKKQFSDTHAVSAVEVNSNDFKYFNDNALTSIPDSDLPRFLSTNENELVFVDLNDSAHAQLCDEVIYLIEPSTIKLNKMIRTDREIFNRLAGKRIVLNKSLLNEKDVEDFEYEANSKVFFNLPNLDDKKDKHHLLEDFASALGVIEDNSDKGDKLFGFKKVN